MKKNHLLSLLVLTALFAMLASCETLLPSAPDEEDLLDGTVTGLTPEQTLQFHRGDLAFNAEVFTAETGLGPIFVATSCGSCHAGDGKGHPFTTLTRFGQVDSTGNSFLNQGGPQWQNRALPGFMPEVLPLTSSASKFTPPANTGLGYLELVSEQDLLAMTDPDDANGDGISGEVNWNNIPATITPQPNAITRGGKYICRFGKKAGTYNLLQQTANAYNQDIGITSTFAPKDAYSGLDIDPEIPTKTIHDVVFYLQTLKAPIQRNATDAAVIAGQKIFTEINCSGCHKTLLRTGFSPIEALSYKTFHPYTDLLVHDMGPALDDRYTEGSARTAEWRTPALWGLGLSPEAQGGQFFLMHDGRAKSIEAAILLHGGEAAASKTKFQNLSQSDKSALLTFLNSL